MSSLSTSPENWSMKAIPGAFALGLVPHCYYVTRLMIATKGKMDNAMPRSNLDVWKNTLPTSLWNQLSRTRASHLNAMETFPLFAAAIIAGNVARLPAKDINSMAFSFLVSRTIYMGLYIGTKSDPLSYLRSGVYAWSIALPLMHLWRAGNALNSE